MRGLKRADYVPVRDRTPAGWQLRRLAGSISDVLDVEGRPVDHPDYDPEQAEAKVPFREWWGRQR